MLRFHALCRNSCRANRALLGIRNEEIRNGNKEMSCGSTDNKKVVWFPDISAFCFWGGRGKHAGKDLGTKLIKRGHEMHKETTVRVHQGWGRLQKWECKPWP